MSFSSPYHMSLGRKRDFPLPFTLTETSGQMGPPSAISGTPRGTISRESRAKFGPDAMTKVRRCRAPI